MSLSFFFCFFCQRFHRKPAFSGKMPPVEETEQKGFYSGKQESRASKLASSGSKKVFFEAKII
jgi:hypothetical protein